MVDAESGGGSREWRSARLGFTIGDFRVPASDRQWWRFGGGRVEVATLG